MHPSKDDRYSITWSARVRLLARGAGILSPPFHFSGSRMKRALLSFAAVLAITCGLAGTVSAAGVTICNNAGSQVLFALGYVGAKGLESTGRFESEPGGCATFLTDVTTGPLYLYATTLTGTMSWTAHGDKTDQAFCVSNAPHFVSRNADYMKDGKLACPVNAVAQFMLVPDVPPGSPRFTFSEDNATDRP
jgi:uncharacterized membrane protein